MPDRKQNPRRLGAISRLGRSYHHDAPGSLLFNVVPAGLHGISRAFVTGAVELVFTALAGLLILAFSMLAMPPGAIALGSAGMGILWLLLALRIKRDYLRALMEHLSEHSLSQRNAALHEAFAMSEDHQDGIHRAAIRAIGSSAQTKISGSLPACSTGLRPKSSARLSSHSFSARPAPACSRFASRTRRLSS